MYFKLKSNIIFRNYKFFGYLTDNRNYGYRYIGDNECIGEKITSQSGAVFLSILGRHPRRLDLLENEICQQYSNTDFEMIKNDVEEFFCQLKLDGFIVSGQTAEECNENDMRPLNTQVISNTKTTSATSKEKSENSTQDFFAKYFNGEPQLSDLHIEITSKCNERCVHCYIPHENKIATMNSNLFYNILEQCKKLNILHLTISGGEPMLHSNFIDFLRKCNEYNFSVNILSNLTLLTPDILDEMKNNPLVGVQTSLYAMNASTHDSITQAPGSFEKTKESILLLKENKIPLQISCPILKQNKNCFYDVIKWGTAHDIHVDSDCIIMARYDHATQNLNSRLCISDVKSVIQQMADEDPHYWTRIKHDAQKKAARNADDFVCSVCRSSICVSESGTAYPCAGWNDYALGNLNEMSLVDIWKKSKKACYLRNLRWRDFPKCCSCPDKDFCIMCLVRNANEDPCGDPLSVNDFFCKIAKFNREMALKI